MVDRYFIHQRTWKNMVNTMNARTNEHMDYTTSPKPKQIELYEKIHKAYEWQGQCKTELRSFDLSATPDGLTALQQVMNKQKTVYQEQQQQLGTLLYGLLQGNEPKQVIEQLAELFHSKQENKLKNGLENIDQIQIDPKQEISELISKTESEKQSKANTQPMNVIPIDEIPSDFSIGQKTWKLSASQRELLNKPSITKHTKTPKSKANNHVFPNAESALNHLTSLLDQEYTHEEFAHELKKILKKSPLDKRDPRLCELLVGIDLPNGKTFKSLRKAVRDYQESLELEETQALSLPEEQAWPFAGHFEGKHIELIGGNPRRETIERLEKALPGASIKWTNAEGGMGERQLSSLEKQARSGSIDVVLLITAFMGHYVSRRFKPLNRLALDAHGRHLNVRLVRGGYGLSRLKAELLHCLESSQA
jgi:hypothetical protein